MQEGIPGFKTRYCSAPCSACRRYRCKQRKSWKIFLRKSNDGCADDGRRQAFWDREVCSPWHYMRISQVLSGAFQRGKSVGRLPRRNKRTIRPCKKDAPRAIPVVQNAVRVQLHIFTSGKSLWPEG